MINQDKKNFCFCTFASGSIYRTLAGNLAKDIEKYSPDTLFIVLTDKPSDFRDYTNVLAFSHRKKGILCYHERRFVIAKSLEMFNSCIYLDADLRICSPVPQNMQWLPGITARSCTNMMKHIQGRIQKTNSPRPNLILELEFYKKMAKKFNLDIEADELIWINEFLFVVTRDSGREMEFLDNWGKLALYSELNGYHKHPAYAIGLAAAKVGFPIRHDIMEGIDFFDDRIEKVRISKGQSTPDAKKEFFEAQEKIEARHRSIPYKIMNKILNISDYGYHSMRLKFTTLIKDFKFYYR